MKSTVFFANRDRIEGLEREMADIQSLAAFKKKKIKQQSAGKTLCKSGRHRWSTDTTTQFDSQQGKLVTRYVCQRCGQIKVKGS